MSSFVNYFAPLAQDERTPIAREPVKNGIRNRRSIARVARRRAIERQRTEDAQVEHNESLTRNTRLSGMSIVISANPQQFNTPASMEERLEATRSLLAGVYDDLNEIRSEMYALNDRLLRNLVVLDHIGTNLLK
jgi:hypothetical protein